MLTKDDLTILLDDNNCLYRPGDTVRGRLQLTLDKDSVIGRVSVQLCGRAVSKIVQLNGQSTSVFHGAVELFREEQVVHNDHYTHKSGVMSWLFAFQIPTSIDASIVQSKWKARDGFLAKSSDRSPDLLPLPPTFHQVDRKSGKAWRAFVAYTIDATVSEPDGSKLPKTHTQNTSLPIYVTLATQDIVDYDNPQFRRGTTTAFVVKTQTLLLGSVQSSSTTQRISSLFRSSKLPKFTFDVDISYQSVLQISHHEPIRFIVSASPRTDAHSTTIQPDMLTFFRYPSLHVKHLKLYLETVTDIRCRSLLGDSCASARYEIPLIDCKFTDAQIAMRSLAWDQKNGTEQDLPMEIDFGKECDSHLRRQQQGPGNSTITPSFRTYNISRRYHLTWIIDLECAGEPLTLKGRTADEVSVIEADNSIANGALPEEMLRMLRSMEEDVGCDDGELSALRHYETNTLPVYSELPEEGHNTSHVTSSIPTRKGG